MTGVQRLQREAFIILRALVKAGCRGTPCVGRQRRHYYLTLRPRQSRVVGARLLAQKALTMRTWAQLDLPHNVEFAVRVVDKQSGVSVRAISDWRFDGIRFDVAGA